MSGTQDKTRPGHHASCTYKNVDKCTLSYAGTHAELCRERGWGVDDVLEARWSGETIRVRLTAIGRDEVLGARAYRDGTEGAEHTWSLTNRCFALV